jgi:hypothetical protein
MRTSPPQQTARPYPTGFSPLPSRRPQRETISPTGRLRGSHTPWYRRKGTDAVGLALLAAAILVLASLIWLVSD